MGPLYLSPSMNKDLAEGLRPLPTRSSSSMNRLGGSATPTSRWWEREVELWCLLRVDFASALWISVESKSSVERARLAWCLGFIAATRDFFLSLCPLSLFPELYLCVRVSLSLSLCEL